MQVHYDEGVATLGNLAGVGSGRDLNLYGGDGGSGMANQSGYVGNLGGYGGDGPLSGWRHRELRHHRQPAAVPRRRGVRSRKRHLGHDAIQRRGGRGRLGSREVVA